MLKMNKGFSLIVSKKIKEHKKTISIDSDKSISIRSFLIGAISHNISEIKNVLESEDVFSTISCLKKLGVKIKKIKPKHYLVFGKGLGSLHAKKGLILNCGNSGTLSRLLIGILSTTPNINVKITIHGPNGELENLEVIHKLENENNIKVNVTAMMSAQQCFIASLAGATYVSLFGGRINDMGYNSVDEIKKLRKLIDDFNLKSKIILGSTREALNVIEWLTAGAHIVTCSPKFLERIIVHPYSKETVKMFLNDGKKIKI